MDQESLYIDLNGDPIPPDQLVWGLGEAAALCGVSRMTVWRWVQRGVFVDGVELWNDFRPGQLRTTTVFHRPALLQVAGSMARYCQQTGAGWRPEQWGRRQRARIEGRTGRPATLQRRTRTLTDADEAALYGFEGIRVPRPPRPNALGALDALADDAMYERIYGTPQTAPRARSVPSPRERVTYPGTRRRSTTRGPVARVDKRVVNATDVRKIWPAFSSAHEEYKLTHEGTNPTIRQWAKILRQDPDETLAVLDERRKEFRNHIPEPPKTRVDAR